MKIRHIFAGFLFALVVIVAAVLHSDMTEKLQRCRNEAITLRYERDTSRDEVERLRSALNESRQGVRDLVEQFQESYTLLTYRGE